LRRFRRAGLRADALGNRQLLLSGVTGIGSQTLSYDVNDRLTTNTYDANGNTLAAGAKTFARDSMDRLTKFNSGAVTMVYDGDGTRVAKTSGGVTTQYLVDDLNPTGLPQVVEEVVGGAVVRRYTYGINRISQTQAGVTSLYDYDAHGDVRALMSTAPVAPGNFATPTDTYGYDAFGNLIGSTGTTPNVYRYQGEALDEETGRYYFRARYYDPVAGRFLTVDPLASEGEPPYEYAAADPVNGHDPTGEQDAIEYAIIVAAFLLPPIHVPLPDTYSCLGGIAYSDAGAARMMALVGAGCSAGGGGNGSGPGAPGAPPTNPEVNCGGTTGRSVNFAQAKGAWDKARQKLDPDKMKQKQPCQKLATSCGTTIDQWMQAVNAMQFFDGTASSRTMSSLFKGGATPGIRAQGANYGDQTISQYLAEENRTGKKPCAVSELGGHAVYLDYPNIVPGDYYRNQSDLLHEALHNLTGLTDSYLQRQMSIKVQADTSNISNKISGSCL